MIQKRKIEWNAEVQHQVCVRRVFFKFLSDSLESVSYFDYGINLCECISYLRAE